MPSDPESFDELELPFIFVPDGAPEPDDLLEGHVDWVKLPATLVADADGDGQTSFSYGNPPPGQRGSTDGLAASSGPTAPRPPTGNAMSDAMSDAMSGARSGGTNETGEHASFPEDPIAAYRRANDALATAASGQPLSYAPQQADAAAAGVRPVDGQIQQEPVAPPPGAALPPPAGEDSDT